MCIPENDRLLNSKVHRNNAILRGCNGVHIQTNTCQNKVHLVESYYDPSAFAPSLFIEAIPCFYSLISHWVREEIYMY